MQENEYQQHIIRRLKRLFPGIVVLKNDANYLQGIPDLLLLYKTRWAMLECKKAVSSKRRPNQEYYIDLLNGMSYASFIFPENEEEVLCELQRAFGSERQTRVPKPK